MNTATLSTKGQLVIPSRFRQALQLKPGDPISFAIEGEKLFMNLPAGFQGPDAGAKAKGGSP